MRVDATVTLRRRIVVLGLLFAAGAAIVAYGAAGLPWARVVRGALGDVLAAAFVAVGLGLVPRWAPHVGARLAAAAAIATALECAQGMGMRADGVTGFVLGRVFDPWDLVAYAVGIGFAAVIERGALRGSRHGLASTGAAPQPAGE